jgi:hypothetical protein
MQRGYFPAINPLPFRAILVLYKQGRQDQVGLAATNVRLPCVSIGPTGLAEVKTVFVNLDWNKEVDWVRLTE